MYREVQCRIHAQEDRNERIKNIRKTLSEIKWSRVSDYFSRGYLNWSYQHGIYIFSDGKQKEILEEETSDRIESGIMKWIKHEVFKNEWSSVGADVEVKHFDVRSALYKNRVSKGMEVWYNSRHKNGQGAFGKTCYLEDTRQQRTWKRNWIFNLIFLKEKNCWVMVWQ